MYPKVKVRQEQHQEGEYHGDDVRDLGLKAFLSLSLYPSTSPVKDQKVVSVPSIVKLPKCYVPAVPIPRVPETEDFGDSSLTFDSSGSAGPEKDGNIDEDKVNTRASLTPQVPVTEDFGDCSLAFDSSGSAGPEMGGNTDENKIHIRASLTPRVPVTEDFGDCSLTSDLSGSGGPEKDGSTDENKVNIRASSIPRPRAVISSPDNDIMIGNRNRIRDGRLSASKNGTVLQNRHAQCKVKSHDSTDIPPDTRKCKEPGSKDKNDPVGKKKVHKGNIKSENLPRNWKF